MLLPEIISIKKTNDLSVALSLHVSENLDFFLGHFPELPILPGIVQINWAIHYGNELLPISGKFVRMDNIKFHSVVVPKTSMNLSLQWVEDKRYLEFVFLNDIQKFSSGRIVFGSDA